MLLITKLHVINVIYNGITSIFCIYKIVVHFGTRISRNDVIKQKTKKTSYKYYL